MGNNVLYILLADDDADDRLFFKEAMEEINSDTLVSFVNDGFQLMYFLNITQARVFFSNLTLTAISVGGATPKRSSEYTLVNSAP